MSWPIMIGIFAGVVASTLYSEKIKRDALKEKEKKDFLKDVSGLEKSEYLKEFEEENKKKNDH